ncbi:AAA domain-containing protein [Tenacibaculum mesophilum]|uniref:AAA domain-containing protein n=1 Tax=Tenacibaculum mesophilum TaxID=104268 RepID=UPI00064A0289
MKGKVIIISKHLGFIEYDIDKRISFFLKDYPNPKIGDSVNFDIVENEVVGTNHSVFRAINIKTTSKSETVKKTFRLNKVLRELNISLDKTIEIYKSYGYEVEARPTTKITEEQYLVLKQHFENITLVTQTKKVDHENGNRGDTIETKIYDIIYPSLVLVNFFGGKKALLPLENLSWNITRSEKTINSLKKGDDIKVVVIKNSKHQPVIVSRKHLLSRPNQTNDWNNLKTGSKVKGTVYEILINKIIIELEIGFFGVLNSNDKKLKKGEKKYFIVNSKNNDNQTLSISLFKQRKEIDSLKKEIENEKRNQKITNVVEEKIKEEALSSIKNFKESIYYALSQQKEIEFIEEAFENTNALFSNSINLPIPLFIQFKMNLPVWESDFKNKLLPHLSKNTSDIDKAIKHLNEQKYWININRYTKDNVEKILWSLFNEDIHLSGFIDTDSFNFIVLNLTIERTNKRKLWLRKKSLKDGSFLFNSNIKFLTPFQDLPLGETNEKVFNTLDYKTKAYNIINRLREESGALLIEEGESLKIFDSFLEFQEDKIKKDNSKKSIRIDSKFTRIKSDLGQFSIELEENLDDLLANTEENKLKVILRIVKESTKKGRDEEKVFFSKALLDSKDDKSRLHFSNSDISISELKNGFYLEPDINVSQFRAQRKVLQDFLNKKIELKHIESLLLKPEKILPPDIPKVDFFNKMLKETEKKNTSNNQVTSVKKAIGNKNIFLIQGPPGTGKTTVIAEIVQQLVKNNEKILVTSQTHIAVDNVLEKLAETKELSLLRLGNLERVNPPLRNFHKDRQLDIYSNHYKELIEINIRIINYYVENNGLPEREQLINYLEEIEKYDDNLKPQLVQQNLDFIDSLINLTSEQASLLPNILSEWALNLSKEENALVQSLLFNSIDVVFATCIRVRTDRDLADYNVKFDTVIIDEAGKANLSESIAAISMAKKVILVGDQMQLPPYIDGSLLDPEEKDSFPNSKFGKRYLNEEIQHALRTSFFEFLVNRIDKEGFPETNIELLNYQHRMHPDIGQFISDAFYNGNVKMGEKTILNKLVLPAPFDKQVVFIDTSTAYSPYESKEGVSVKNDTEAQCITQLVIPKLLEANLNTDQFAVVAPYKSQVANIKKHLKSANIPNYNQVEVSTLDSFQGMEFDVIIFSFTRSEKNTKVGFLDDARRLNVAFSRAKKKLILIGNSVTLKDPRSHYDQLFPYTDLFKKLVNLSNEESVGNFVNVTDYTNLKSKFQVNKGDYKEGQRVICSHKTTFEKDNYLGHIFILENGLEAMFRDNNKEYIYEQGLDYQLFIKFINQERESIYLTTKEPVKAIFLREQKKGNKIQATYKTSIYNGHFFQIDFGFDCFMYDPKQINQFKKGVQYDLIIDKIDKTNKRVYVNLEDAKNHRTPFKRKKRIPKEKSSFNNEVVKLKFFKSHSKGQVINVKFKKSIDAGHFFKLDKGFDGFYKDTSKSQKYFIRDKEYPMRIVNMNEHKKQVSLEPIKK